MKAGTGAAKQQRVCQEHQPKVRLPSSALCYVAYGNLQAFEHLILIRKPHYVGS